MVARQDQFERACGEGFDHGGFSRAMTEAQTANAGRRAHSEFFVQVVHCGPRYSPLASQQPQSLDAEVFLDDTVAELVDGAGFDDAAAIHDREGVAEFAHKIQVLFD